MKAKPRAWELLGADGPIANTLAGFNPRLPQQAMAATIEEVLAEQGTLLCEAGTGTGKTLAYLVPCLDVDKKTIISTATKTLQDQLFERDIPLVQKALDVPLKLALLKGRANYLCKHRLEAAKGANDMSRDELADLVYLDEWGRYTETGDIASASELPDEARIWPLVTSTVDNCLGQNCGYFDDCFVVKARREAVAADVVVVNHHLLFADMALREEGFAELLPSASVVVIDEAHQVPDIASKFFGSSLSSHQLLDLSKDALKVGNTEAADQPRLRRSAEHLQDVVHQFIIALRRCGARGEWARLKADARVVECFEALSTALIDLRDDLEIASDRGPQAEHCYHRSLRFRARLELYLGEEEDVDFEWIRWFETTTRGASLHATPVSVADPFQSMLKDYATAWIFTSATLSVNGDFSHFRRELGLVDPTEACWDSPFEYATQGYLYLPQILVEPRDPSYGSAVIEVCVPLIEAAQGRTFILFTSYAALQACSEVLAVRVDHPLLVQGQAPRAELLKQFESLGNAVLLGTATFWQGIDVRGAGLSCVIIDKLPFTPPDDPVTQARIKALKAAGGNPFFDYQVPEAVIGLKQGAGRLIRDASDRGVLVLCDPRIETKGYGRAFLRSMPALEQTHELEKVVDFLREL